MDRYRASQWPVDVQRLVATNQLDIADLLNLEIRQPLAAAIIRGPSDAPVRERILVLLSQFQGECPERQSFSDLIHAVRCAIGRAQS